MATRLAITHHTFQLLRFCKIYTGRRPLTEHLPVLFRHPRKRQTAAPRTAHLPKSFGHRAFRKYRRVGWRHIRTNLRRTGRRRAAAASKRRRMRAQTQAQVVVLEDKRPQRGVFLLHATSRNLRNPVHKRTSQKPPEARPSHAQKRARFTAHAHLRILNRTTRAVGDVIAHRPKAFEWLDVLTGVPCTASNTSPQRAAILVEKLSRFLPDPQIDANFACAHGLTAWRRHAIVIAVQVAGTHHRHSEV